MDLSNKLSNNLKRCIKEALKQATTYQAPHVGINFFLLALFQQKGSLAYEMLHQKELTFDELQNVLLGQPELLPPTQKNLPPLSLSPELQDMLLRSFLLAQKHHHFFVGTEHCLAVLLDNPPHILSHVCELYGLDKKKLQQQVQALLRGNSKFPELKAKEPNGDH